MIRKLASVRDKRFVEFTNSVELARRVLKRTALNWFYIPSLRSKRFQTDLLTSGILTPWIFKCIFYNCYNSFLDRKWIQSDTEVVFDLSILDPPLPNWKTAVWTVWIVVSISLGKLDVENRAPFSGAKFLR